MIESRDYRTRYFFTLFYCINSNNKKPVVAVVVAVAD
jgi:hypothetical protein